MPMDDGEAMTEVWEGMATDGYIRSIRMKTRKNRIFRIEDAPRRSTSLYDRVIYTLVDQPNNEPSRVFFQCQRLYGISHSASDSPKPNGEGDAGSIRLDGLQEPVMTAERDTIWLGFRHDNAWTEDACPHVAEMAFEPLGMAPMDVLVIPLRGLLD
ncbi:hypothetical protein NW759_003099 [Fusarium solani]|nr:hypothetical protein NW759_003099 [Fusarium solani]